MTGALRGDKTTEVRTLFSRVTSEIVTTCSEVNEKANIDRVVQKLAHNKPRIN
jgi:hypothetical protein